MGTPGIYDRFFIFISLPLALALPYFFGSFEIKIRRQVAWVFIRFLFLFSVFGLLFGSLLVKFSIVSFYHPSRSEIKAYEYTIVYFYYYNDSRKIIVPDKDTPQFVYFMVKYNSSISIAKFIWFSRVPADQVCRYASLIVFSPRLYAFPEFYVEALLPVERLVESSLLVGSNRVFDTGDTYLVYLIR
ncbi:MAG: hypothetical protein DRO67_02225 [Candidatus Asgardarchaeum californiense]|nr:MAG: hypothetical protein DRO67_02225 [Candidatus Asgardarchaeum californiense]